MSGSYQTGPYYAGAAGEALDMYARVRRDASGEIVEADGGETALGFVEQDFADGDPVTIIPFTHVGTAVGIAADSFSDGATLYQADDGEISDSVDGDPIGTAFEAATAQGDEIEYLPEGATLDTTSTEFANILDSNGNESLVISATSSAVNEVDVVNAATGNDPAMEASGDDSDIGLDIVSKGTGFVTLVADDTDAVSVQKDTDVKVGFFDTTPVAQPSHVADATAVSLTQSASAVSADGSVTVADGSAPSNDEIYELAIELKAVQDELVSKVNTLLSDLADLGLQASS